MESAHSVCPKHEVQMGQSDVKCGNSKPDSDFLMWDMKNVGRRSRNAAACDTCMQEDEAKRKEMCRRNQKDVQKSHDGMSVRQPVLNPKVKVFCSECAAAQEIDFDVVWKKGRGSNVFY